MFGLFTDKETDRIATSIFIYVYNLQQSFSWEGLTELIKKGIPEDNRMLSQTEAHWSVDNFNDFTFQANKDEERFSVYIYSSNGGTKKYFGLSVHISSAGHWGIHLNDSMLGGGFSKKAATFSERLKLQLIKANVDVATYVNGKRNFWENL